MSFRRVSVVVCLLAASRVFAGDLNPPAGPVAPTMKNLQEVEPRTPVNATNTSGNASSLFVISQPGSYYLTGNIAGVAAKNGITIVSGNVTLDLEGFAVIGVASSLNGIIVPNYVENVVIRNGNVRGWGGAGISARIDVGRIEHITSSRNTGWGIDASFNTYTSHITSCESLGNTAGGILVSNAAIVSDCIAQQNGGVGIASNGVGSSITGCVSSVNTTNGIVLGSNSTARGNTCTDNGSGGVGAGILVTGSQCVVENNQLTGADFGLQISGSLNVVRANTVNSSADNYDISPNNRLSLILSQIPESIDWPADVTLSGALTGVGGSAGVTIAADDVTLDLGGQALIGVPGALDGVTVTGSRRNINVRNGSVRAWPGDGIDLGNTFNSSVKDVSASTNTGFGILTGGSGLVSGCNSNANASDNIRVGGSSKVENCIANASTGGHGINASFTQSIVAGCTANANAMSGIRASQRTLVQNCMCSNNTLHGVHITFGGAVEGCYINSNVGDGILTDAGGIATIRNNSISESSGAGDAGIRIANPGGCIVEGNTVCLCNTGFLVPSSQNVVVGNSAIANATNFNIAAGNTAGPIVTPGTAAAATNPLANYSN